LAKSVVCFVTHISPRRPAMYLSSSTALPRARQQLATLPTRAQCINKPVRHAGSGSTSQRIVWMAATPPGTGPQPVQQQPEVWWWRHTRPVVAVSSGFFAGSQADIDDMDDSPLF
jgi:hypothetical protein